MLSCREDAYQCQCLLACDRDYDPRVLYCGVSSGRGRREYNGQGMRRAASKSGIEGEYNRQNAQSAVCHRHWPVTPGEAPIRHDECRSLRGTRHNEKLS